MKDVRVEDSGHDSSSLASSFIVLSDVSDITVQGKDGHCLDDPRQGCVPFVLPDSSSDYKMRRHEPLVSSENSLLDCDNGTATDVDNCLPQKWEIAGGVRKRFRTSRMESEQNQTNADIMPGYEICIGMPAQDCDRNEEECGGQWSQAGRNSSGSSKSSIEEPFELL